VRRKSFSLLVSRFQQCPRLIVPEQSLGRSIAALFTCALKQEQALIEIIDDFQS
jgi:hypothetical protein